MPGGGIPSPGDGGSDGPSGQSEGSGDSGGEVGQFPSEDETGVPPPPSSQGGGGGEGESDSESGTSGEGGDAAEDPYWEEERSDSSDCNEDDGLPGGIGGMGTDGECLGGGGGAAEAESDGGDAGGSTQGTGGAGEVGEFPEESDAERAERLGRELDKSIGGFDETLQEEQEEIAAAGRNTEGFGEGATGAGGGGISLGQQASGAGPITVMNTGVQHDSPGAAMSAEEISERTPDDIPVMVDDDIIARQLREAALAEEDPALRERLWEEYRKYSGL
jgi:hypothetical protein